MGHAFTPDSWPMHLGLASHQPLNAAIEGSNMAHMVSRRQQLDQQVQADITVVYLGWHNLIYGEMGEAHWESQLRQFLGSRVTAFCTLVSCMTEDFRTRGFGPLLKRDALTMTVGSSDDARALNEDFFNFWMELEPTPEVIAQVLDQIDRYNRFLRDFCLATGSVLVDLHGAFTPPRYEDAPADFFDVCHLRPRSYGKVGAFVGDRLRPHLEAAAPARRPSLIDRALGRKPPAAGSEDLKKNVYPLW
jgi:hypothetical protein